MRLASCRLRFHEGNRKMAHMVLKYSISYHLDRVRPSQSKLTMQALNHKRAVSESDYGPKASLDKSRDSKVAAFGSELVCYNTGPSLSSPHHYHC